MLVEGGARVITSFLSSGIADRLVVGIAPRVLGDGTEAVQDLGITEVANSIRIERRTVHVVGDDVVIAGDLARRHATTGRWDSTRRGHPASVPRSGPSVSSISRSPGLVEAPRRNVSRKTHSRNPDGSRSLRAEQRTPRPRRKLRAYVEVLHHVPVDGDEAADLTVRLGDEHVLIARTMLAMKWKVSSSVWMFGRTVSVALEEGRAG